MLGWAGADDHAMDQGGSYGWLFFLDIQGDDRGFANGASVSYSRRIARQLAAGRTRPVAVIDPEHCTDRYRLNPVLEVEALG